jgi:hypothetical protein
VEYAAGAGCIRDVAIPVPTRGDVMLRPSFGRFVRALGAPCETTAAGPGLDTAEMDALAGSGPLASRDKIRPPDTIATPLVPWLLAAALALALLEILVRRGSAPLWSTLDDEPSTSENAA